MATVLTLEHPLAAAHRGSRILWPENTMVAFQGAIDLGYRFIETDLHATADGTLVTLHDDTLDRTTNGTGSIWDWPLAALGDVDAGYRFESDGVHPHRGRGVGVPAFEEVVLTFPEACFILDLKQDDIEGLLAEFLARHHLEERVVVGSFSDARLRTFRAVTGGRVATSAGPAETLRARARSWLGRPPRGPADAFQVPVRQGIRIVDRAFLDAVHEAGKQVHVWTVDDRPEMTRLLDLGADGLITDRPDVLKDVLESRGGGPW